MEKRKCMQWMKPQFVFLKLAFSSRNSFKYTLTLTHSHTHAPSVYTLANKFYCLITVKPRILSWLTRFSVAHAFFSTHALSHSLSLPLGLSRVEPSFAAALRLYTLCVRRRSVSFAFISHSVASRLVLRDLHLFRIKFNYKEFNFLSVNMFLKLHNLFVLLLACNYVLHAVYAAGSKKQQQQQNQGRFLLT